MAVGKPLTRVDAKAKVTGRARYTDDFSMPGMKTAMYLRSSVAHGRVESIDVSTARALEGVVAVFTFEDVPKIPFATAGHPFSLDSDHQDRADRLLLTDRVRYWGDEIAVVVARDELTARRAVDLIKVDYRHLKLLIGPDQALAAGAPEIHQGTGNVVNEHSFVVGGDLDQAREQADRLLAGRFTTQIQQHCQLENHTAYAFMDDPDRITIVSSTQIPHIVRRIVSQALDFPLGMIKVVKPYLGGGFGSKQDVVLEPMVAFLTWRLGGVPVKMSLSREECMIGSRVRHPFRIDVNLGVDDDGSLRFIDFRSLSNTGGYASHGHSIASAGAAKAHYLYPRAVYSCRAKTFYSNIPVGGAMRAYGSPQMIWALECLTEEAARAVGMDPVDFRLKNAARPGDLNQLSQKPITTCGLVQCLEKGRRLIRWDEKKAGMPKNRIGPVRRGLGVACLSYASGTYPENVESAGARLILNQDGSFLLQVGAVEIGQGSDTVFVQMAAKTLGVAPSTVHLVSTQDTDLTPFDSGAYASRQTYVGGQAVRRAAEKIKGEVLAYAGLIRGLEIGELELAGDRVVFKQSPGQAVISLADLALDAYYHKDRGGQITAEESFKARTNAPSFGCTFVDLEVDIPLCKVKINEIYNIHDAGVIINPLNARGQVHGGQAMAVGAGLYEELLIDEDSGRILNNNLVDYKIPTIMDIPDLGAAFVETEEPTGPFGAKSLGEPPVISPPPAIRNAVLDATGVAINQLPLSPQVLFKHFKAAGLI